jgi:hypothetical protein
MQLEQPKNTDLVIGYLLENCKPKVKISTKPNVLASVDVDFHVMKIKGFMVREKDGKLWGGWNRQTVGPCFWMKSVN